MHGYNALFSAGCIGPMQLRNRMVLPAMGSGLAEPDGTCGSRIRAYHEEHARGGSALVIMGVVGVGLPTGQNMANQPAISHDRYVPGLRAVAEAIHAHGAKFAVQLHFGGLVAVIDMIAGNPAWTPSLPEHEAGDMMDAFLPEEAVATPFFKMPPPQYKVMTERDIATLVGMFGDAARRARLAGADGLEIHGGHGYIISSFLSPATNKRTDAYGGSVENRSRLLVEILRAVRLEAGPDIAVWCKIDAVEYGRKGGITLEDAKVTARLAEQAGAGAISVTAYHDPSQGVLHSGSHTPDQPGLNVDKAISLKRAVSIPVIVSGRIEPEHGERLVASRSVDFVAMGRKLLADPHLPRKLEQGRAADIVPCIYCYTCISAIYYGGSVRCAVNPQCAFEQEPWSTSAAARRRIAVVGGGPAGMEAARRLSLRGHDVTLFEQSDRLGGTLRIAALAYEPNERILDWLIRQIEQSEVNVRLGTRATPELLASLQPDVVVVASGARRTLPTLAGADLPHVWSGDELRQLLLGDRLEDLAGKTSIATRLTSKAARLAGVTQSVSRTRLATRAWMPLGRRIVIIGGELVGLELAEFLVARDREVTVIDDVPKLGAGLQIVRRWRVLDALRHHGVRLIAAARNISIRTEAVAAISAAGESLSIAADEVIVAKGATEDLRLAEQLRMAGLTVHPIGDCTGVGYIEGAMRSAAQLAQAI
jgi:2,4-dienoyl-CoA reductase (NADPH2)